MTPSSSLLNCVPYLSCPRSLRTPLPYLLAPPQAECLCQPDVLLGKNLVYCAPTSGGKSIVSEILALRRLLTTGKPFMLVLPFVALCNEKAVSVEKCEKYRPPPGGGPLSASFILPSLLFPEPFHSSSFIHPPCPLPTI